MMPGSGARLHQVARYQRTSARACELPWASAHPRRQSPVRASIPPDWEMGLKPLPINKFVDVTWHLTITSAPTVVRPKESRGRKGGTKKWHALTGAGS